MNSETLAGLMEISLGRGPYKRDPLEHADSCIEAMKTTAIEAIAASYWHRDYPEGGSMYKTYDSLQHHDKEIYRKEAKEAIEKYKYEGRE